MTYTAASIAHILGAHLVRDEGAEPVMHLVYDTRRISFPEASLFICLEGPHNDGHRYIADAYKAGVRNFLVSKGSSLPAMPGASVVLVPDTLAALQHLAAWHRQQFKIPVIGVTGSNGKTVVKEWLYQLLQQDYKIARSPRSHNSQIGVPLSVWQLDSTHTLAIFEAGISAPGEMDRLEEIIKPTVGILTNIGAAHDAGFSSRKEKLQEKMKLFAGVEVLIGRFTDLEHAGVNDGTQVLSWSFGDEGGLRVEKLTSKQHTLLKTNYQGQGFELDIPYTDEASIENVTHCWMLLMWLGKSNKDIQERFSQLHKVDMRMQLLQGLHDCLIINDSYSADLDSLQVALQFQHQQRTGLNKTAILSDFLQTGLDEKKLYGQIMSLLQAHGVGKLVAIGPAFSSFLADHYQGSKGMAIQTFSDAEAFISHFRASQFSKELILVKGSRNFHLEKIVSLFIQKKHQTTLQINLDALAHNLRVFRRKLNPATKIMAMVKAFSYGSGSAEIANVLQYNHVDYLAVAYADEGVQLVDAGITTPVMVMNTDPESFALIIEHGLQPVLYATDMLQSFARYLSDQGITHYPVHLEVDTGMNRLGISLDDLEEAISLIKQYPQLHIVSAFTHLAGSDSASLDAFTQQQQIKFQKAYQVLEEALGYHPLMHISNSAAVLRHPHLQGNMVRLGIGMYGINPAPGVNLELQPVASLYSTISQVRRVKQGDSVSYNRSGIMEKDALLGVVRIGYADGYSRRFSRGVGSMWVRGQLAPVVGNVCMDMTMIDITGIEGVQEGDTVEIFGTNLPVERLAAWIDTIPYEILTGVSQRVKRVYLSD